MVLSFFDKNLQKIQEFRIKASKLIQGKNTYVKKLYLQCILYVYRIFYGFEMAWNRSERLDRIYFKL